MDDLKFAEDQIEFEALDGAKKKLTRTDRLLGQGSYGNVYYAIGYEGSNPVEYAIKEIKSEQLKTTLEISKLQWEKMIMGKL